MSALDEWRKGEGRRNRPEPKPEPEPIVPRYTILHRKKTLVPTAGSQRRCYNGCFHPSDWETVWTAWSVLERNMPESRLEFWRELNDYAVSQRGSSDASEYKLEEKSNE